MNSRPIIVGDRVSHYFHGEGTVVVVDEKFEIKPEFQLYYNGLNELRLMRVDWDNHSVTWEPEYLLNLIGGQKPTSV